MTIRIRPAEQPDLPLLLALYRHLSTEAPPEPEAVARSWQALLANPAITTFLGQRTGEPICTCTLVITPTLTRAARPFALIETVVTHVDRRRQGHGQAVLRTALDVAWAADCCKVMLLTGPKQDSTMRFYEGAGFRLGEKTGFVACPVGLA